MTVKVTECEKVIVHELKSREKVLHVHALCGFFPTGDGVNECVCDDLIIHRLDIEESQYEEIRATKKINVKHT